MIDRPPGDRASRRRRHPSGRLLAVGAVACAVALSACGGGSGGGSAHANARAAAHSATHGGLYGSLPAVGAPRSGGTLTVSQLSGSTPTYIFPVTPAADGTTETVYDFTNQLYLPLYSQPDGATPAINGPLSLAQLPRYSDGGRTVTIPMKTTYRWSNGAPVDADDVVFYIDLVKQAVKESAANYNNYTPGSFPDNVASATTDGRFTVVLHLTHAYNDTWFTDNELMLPYAIPSTTWDHASAGGPALDWRKPANARAIYNYLSKQGGRLATFATDPLWKDVDGPFHLSSFSLTNSSYTLTPNPRYSGPIKPRFHQLQWQTFTGITPLLNALRSHSLDVGQLDLSELSEVPGLRSAGFHVFGYPTGGWQGAILNFKDTTDHFDKVIGQLYVRQALAHLVDQPAYLTGLLKHAGVLAYSTVSVVPPSPYVPGDAVHTPYPYSAAAAAGLLRAHGWKVVPRGQTTCAHPGTGRGECGAGIPAGTPLRLNWFYSNASPIYGLESDAFASAARQVGVTVNLEAKTFNYLVSNFNDASSASSRYTNDWSVSYFGGFGLLLYPTTDTILNSSGDFNLGGYSDPTADRLIDASVFADNSEAVRTEAGYLTRDLPVLFMPNPDQLFAVSDSVGGAPAGFMSMTQQYDFPQYWYLRRK